MRIPAWLTKIRDAFNWGLFAYRLILILAASGVLGSVGGAIWAMLTGVPLPIAIMAGYCTFVGAIYLGIAPLAYRVLSQVPMRANKVPMSPNYTAWRHLSAYELQDAAKLWAGIDPNAASNHDSVAWLEVFRAKITSGEFDIIPRNTSTRHSERMAPNEFTKIKKESLKKFATTHGYDPIFLRD